MKRILASAALALFALTASAFAHDYKIGDLVINHPWSKATLPNQPVAGGFMSITNNGSEADRLVSGTATFAGEVQMHEMGMEGDVMKMRQLEDGLEIPAGATVELKPGGFHVMFMKLAERLNAGELRKATLTFEKAGTIELEFKVEDAKPGEGGHDHGAHGQKHGAADQAAGDDATAIAAVMGKQFDRPDAPLTVEPVAVSGEWAVAGWAQDKTGGRALLKKGMHGWAIHMCGGEGFRQAANLARIGLPQADADAIAASLATAETALGADKIALFDSFEGEIVIEGGDHGAHGAASGHDAHKGHKAHGG